VLPATQSPRFCRDTGPPSWRVLCFWVGELPRYAPVMPANLPVGRDLCDSGKPIPASLVIAERRWLRILSLFLASHLRAYSRAFSGLAARLAARWAVGCGTDN
jgi:hypothetical protein